MLRLPCTNCPWKDRPEHVQPCRPINCITDDGPCFEVLNRLQERRMKELAPA